MQFENNVVKVSLQLIILLVIKNTYIDIINKYSVRCH